jgi:hypothetical protein
MKHQDGTINNGCFEDSEKQHVINPFTVINTQLNILLLESKSPLLKTSNLPLVLTTNVRELIKLQIYLTVSLSL